MPESIELSQDEARHLVEAACRGAGAGPALAQSMARAVLSAALDGVEGMGFAHLVAYLVALREGRITGDAEPVLSHPLPALIHADAGGGIAQLGFERAFDDLVTAARTFGVAIFSQRNSYTTGEIGYYVRLLVGAGLVSLAVANGPALMAPAGGTRAVYCTNPLAFGAPLPGRPPLVIDQATSATAFVNVLEAANEGRSIPQGWAIDENGAPTTDAAAAVRGALLAFGGARGANIALMVEVLAAGLSGASWSLDAPDFRSGDRSPDAGLTVIAIAPAAFGTDFAERFGLQARRLEDYGVYLPGRRAEKTPHSPSTPVAISARNLAEIRRFIPEGA